MYIIYQVLIYRAVLIIRWHQTCLCRFTTNKSPINHTIRQMYRHIQGIVTSRLSLGSLAIAKYAHVLHFKWYEAPDMRWPKQGTQGTHFFLFVFDLLLQKYMPAVFSSNRWGLLSSLSAQNCFSVHRHFCLTPVLFPIKQTGSQGYCEPMAQFKAATLQGNHLKVSPFWGFLGHAYLDHRTVTRKGRQDKDSGPSKIVDRGRMPFGS